MPLLPHPTRVHSWEIPSFLKTLWSKFPLRKPLSRSEEPLTQTVQWNSICHFLLDTALVPLHWQAVMERHGVGIWEESQTSGGKVDKLKERRSHIPPDGQRGVETELRQELSIELRKHLQAVVRRPLFMDSSQACLSHGSYITEGPGWAMSLPLILASLFIKWYT